MQRYQFMSYNIRKGKGVIRSRPELAEIAYHIKQKTPNILLCQEVAQYHGEKNLKQDEQLSRLLGMPHCYGPNAFFETRNHGNACFSHFPIVCHTNFNVSTNRFEQRGILLTEIILPETTLYVFNVHFGLTPMQRRHQARTLHLLIQKEVPSEAPIIIGGDFNDVSGWIDRYIEKEDHVKSALAHLNKDDRRSWGSRRPLLSLDRIYYRNLFVHEVAVLKGKPWAGLSDHLPLWMTFEIRLPEKDFT